MKLAVAVSGGTDSFYALASLKEQGKDLLALHAVFLPEYSRPPGYPEMLAALEKTCAALSVPLQVVDLSERFASRIIEPFIRAYAEGKTPNPCAACNAAMKFGLLLDAAEGMGAQALVTGHYVRLIHDAEQNSPGLYSGLDPLKDQSYFLAMTPLQRLSGACFPLGGLLKSEIRQWLAQRSLQPPAPGESQEVCFIPGDDYRAFLAAMAERLGISLPGPGEAVLEDGTPIGQHQGLWRYTEGQRRGLGLPWKEPLYVLRKERAGNRLVVGPAERLGSPGFCCATLNILVPPTAWPDELLVRTRYRQAPCPVVVRFEKERVVFEPVHPGGPYSPGQVAALYGREHGKDSLRVLAGGIIVSSWP